MGRRTFLTVGAVGGLGLTLADLFRVQKAQADLKKYDFIPAKAQSVIHVFLPGGMAHQESFDPKPFSPIEYRGEMGSIKTKTGDVVSETIPKLAAISDKLAIIPSMTHGEAAQYGVASQPVSLLDPGSPSASLQASGKGVESLLLTADSAPPASGPGESWLGPYGAPPPPPLP